MTRFSKALFLAIVVAVISGVLILAYSSPWTDMAWQRLWFEVASAACFGFLLGGVYAFDPRSGFTIKTSVTGRVVFGIVASLGLSALWHWPFLGMVVAALSGAALGYFGMAWAKHVDDVSF
jgi:hypothetical protein